MSARAAVAEAPDLESCSANEVLAYAVERFHPLMYVACSFQKEDSVILDMALAIEPRARVFTLDTGVLFPETYAYWRALERRYGISIDAYRGIPLERQAAVHGDALWAREPDLCCDIRKVRPLARALAGVDAWVTGVRRAQSPTRAGTPKLGWDERHGCFKLSPLADWPDEAVGAYLDEREIPYNPLHDAGYASIGCTHCTRPGAGREGRWAGSVKTECGLHPAGGPAATA